MVLPTDSAVDLELELAVLVVVHGQTAVMFGVHEAIQMSSVETARRTVEDARRSRLDSSYAHICTAGVCRRNTAVSQHTAHTRGKTGDISLQVLRHHMQLRRCRLPIWCSCSTKQIIVLVGRLPVVLAGVSNTDVTK